MSTKGLVLNLDKDWPHIETEGNANKEEQSIPIDVATIAARELRETPDTRKQALILMKEWIKKNGDIRNVRLDDSFLLRFLRHKKYSVPMAQQTLLKYLNLRKFYANSFKFLNCEERNVASILQNGYIVVSPKRDCEGRRIIIYSMSKFDSTRFNCWDMCRAHVVVYESLLEDPTNQVCGFVHVGDGKGSAALITLWEPADFARILKWGEQSLPMRHKAVHFINIPAAIKYVVDFATSKVSEKMAERLHIHSNITSLHQYVDVAALPTTFGGKLLLPDMVQFTRKLLLKQKKKLADLDEMEILSAKGILSSRNNKVAFEENGSMHGSFRKLEID